MWGIGWLLEKLCLKTQKESSANPPEGMSAELLKYRDYLFEVQKQSQNDYDKRLFGASSGALGISFAFVDKFLHGHFNWPWLLFMAWILWGIAIVSNLYSYYSSAMAHEKAIKQVDSEKIYRDVPGGWLDNATRTLNGLGGLCFLAGIVLLILFIQRNLDGAYAGNEPSSKPMLVELKTNGSLCPACCEQNTISVLPQSAPAIAKTGQASNEGKMRKTSVGQRRKRAEEGKNPNDRPN